MLERIYRWWLDYMWLSRITVEGCYGQMRGPGFWLPFLDIRVTFQRYSEWSQE